MAPRSPEHVDRWRTSSEVLDGCLSHLPAGWYDALRAAAEEVAIMGEAKEVDRAVWLLWGKADAAVVAEAALGGERAPAWHPLLCHCVEVASVARRMHQSALPPSVVQRMVAATLADPAAGNRDRALV